MIHRMLTGAKPYTHRDTLWSMHALSALYVVFSSNLRKSQPCTDRDPARQLQEKVKAAARSWGERGCRPGARFGKPLQLPARRAHARAAAAAGFVPRRALQTEHPTGPSGRGVSQRDAAGAGAVGWHLVGENHETHPTLVGYGMHGPMHGHMVGLPPPAAKPGCIPNPLGFASRDLYSGAAVQEAAAMPLAASHLPESHAGSPSMCGQRAALLRAVQDAVTEAAAHIRRGPLPQSCLCNMQACIPHVLHPL